MKKYEVEGTLVCPGSDPSIMACHGSWFFNTKQEAILFTKKYKKQKVWTFKIFKARKRI